MVPKVAKAGRSFKGAALYYLHDKKAKTAERVAFVETVNLPTDNADRAVAHMIDTATHADELKRAAGVRMSGQRMDKPVYCYSLAWHPSQAPTMAEQIAAARETMKKLGIEDRQALIVGHTDTDHPHVHILVNRVCPETGRAANMGNDQLILSKWAEKYERDHGQVFCDKRVENNARRKGEFVKDQSMTRQEWVAWKKSQTKDIWDSFRADRAEARASRRGQFDALWRQKEEQFAFRRDEIKQLYKPIWRDVFKRQKLDLRDYDAGLTRRIGFALSRDNRSSLVGLLQAMTNDSSLRDDFIRKQEAERAEISKGQRDRIRDAGREVTKAWKYDRDQLNALHKEQDDKAHSQTKAKVDDLWREKSPEQTQEEFTQSASPKKARDPENRRRKSASEIMKEQRKRSRTRRPRR